MPMIERRDISPKDLALRSEDAGAIIEGYAAVFNVRTVIWDFEESIAPGAFTRSIASGFNTRALFNHDPNYVLGCIKNGMLSLREDATGLWTETIPPKSPIAESIVENVRRGDVTGMSFAFTVRKDEWIFADSADRMDQRVITEVGILYDVGPVTYPAYEQTSVKVKNEAKKIHEEARSRWEQRRKSTIVVPAEIENCLRECRTSDSSDVWIDEDVAALEAKPDETVEAENKETVTGGGEAQTEPTGESEAPAPVDEPKGEDQGGLSAEEKESVSAINEAINREIELKRAISKVSSATRNVLS